jgi:acyl carrier protein
MLDLSQLAIGGTIERGLIQPGGLRMERPEFPSIDEVLKELHRIIGSDSSTPSSRIADMEIDSLALVEWVSSLEEEYNLTIDDELLLRAVRFDSTFENLYEALASSASTQH